MTKYAKGKSTPNSVEPIRRTTLPPVGHTSGDIDALFSIATRRAFGYHLRNPAQTTAVHDNASEEIPELLPADRENAD